MFNSSKTFVIAEAGINHNGDFNLAKKLVVAAKLAGADAIKFQAFKTEELLIEETEKTAHFKKGKKSVFEQLKSWELSAEEFKQLATFARKQKIILFASVFDLNSLDMLEKIGMPLYKIGSADLNNLPLLTEVAKTKKPVIISNGMGNLDEIKEAVKIFEGRKKRKSIRSKSNLAILHCISLYPPLPEEFHLEKIAILQKTFPKHTVGYSDHSLDIFMPVCAVTLGAKIIEKHITLGKNMSGPDQKSSADPKEFAKMVEQIRIAKKAINANNSKTSQFILVPREQKMKAVFRRSIVSNVPIKKGVLITKEMLSLKRPGTGLAPSEISKIIGKKTMRDLPKNTLIAFKDTI